MKSFIVFALIAAVASARTYIQHNDLLDLTESQMAEVQQILEAIHSPSTDPTTAAMLEEMLYEILGLTPVKPPVSIPDPVEGSEPIDIGPALIDDFQPIDISPEIVDFPVFEDIGSPDTVSPVAEVPSSSPLVQIIVNVNKEAGAVSPVQVDHAEDLVPSPVHVVEDAEDSILLPTPVVDAEEVVAEMEPVIVAPIIVAPAVVGPDTLN